MIRSTLTTLTAVTASLFLFSSCGKKKVVTPLIKPLSAQVELNISDYQQEYTKESDSLFNLTKSAAVVVIRQTTNFSEEQFFAGPDTTLPDTAKGEYDRIKLVAPDTIEQQFNSPIGDDLVKSHIICPMEFTSGTAEDLTAGKAVSLKHSQAGREELIALYSDQLEKEYGAMTEKIMWQEIEKKVAHLFSSEEAHQRYRLTVKSSVTTSKLPDTKLDVENDVMVLSYVEPLFFSVKFDGIIDIIK